jgi:predicted phosphodiesterase
VGVESHHTLFFLQKANMSIIVVSDFHLGAANSQSKKIDKILDVAKSYDEIVINGDLTDSKLPRLKKKEWKILEHITKLTKHHKVTIVRGNHDAKTEDGLSSMLGLKYVDSYIVKSGLSRFYFEHGHNYDDFIIKNPGLTALADAIYNTLQVLDPSHTIAKIAKHSSKEFLRSNNKVKLGVTEKAAVEGCDWGVAGHTHHAQLDEKVRYINTGCFTEKPCTYVTIKKGEPKLHHA